MATPGKVSTVAEISDKFRSSTAAVVTEYRGLTTAQLTQLRRNLGSEVAYTVAKNTLVRRAASDAGVQGLDELFTGPTAIAFITGEPVNAAKALRDFSKDNSQLLIKGGLMDGSVLNPTEIGKLADLESREVLLAKLAGAMKAGLSQAAAMFNQLPSQVARLAAALQEKKAEAGETAEAPAAAAEPAEAPAAAAEPAEAVRATEVPSVDTEQAAADPSD